MIRKATSIPIKNLRASKAITDTINLAFVITFDPNNKSRFPLIQTAFNSLKQAYESKECFKDTELRKSQRQQPSLKRF